MSLRTVERPGDITLTQYAKSRYPGSTVVPVSSISPHRIEDAMTRVLVRLGQGKQLTELDGRVVGIRGDKIIFETQVLDKDGRTSTSTNRISPNSPAVFIPLVPLRFAS